MLGSDGREAKMFRKRTGRDGRNVEVMSKIGRSKRNPNDVGKQS